MTTTLVPALAGGEAGSRRVTGASARPGFSARFIQSNTPVPTMSSRAAREPEGGPGASRRARLRGLRRGRRGALRLPVHVDMKRMDRIRKVLHFPVPEILKGQRDLVCDSLLHIARDTDGTGLGEGLQPCGNVYPITQKVAIALHDIADGDADAEMHLPVRREGEIAGAERFLDVDGAARGFHRTGEFRTSRCRQRC